MLPQNHFRLAQRIGSLGTVVALTATLTLWALLPRLVRSAEPLRDSSSLKFVPADAAAYVSWLRLGEQFAAIAKSNAWARLAELPALKAALAQWNGQSSGPMAQQLALVRTLLALPENQELLALVGDAFSQEVFVYTGDSMGEFLALMNSFNQAMNTAQLEALQEPGDREAALARKMLEMSSSLADKLRVPDLIIGFKISDPQRAESQISRLEKALTGQLESQPALRARLTREAIGAAHFLTLRLDGSLVPWDQIRHEELQGANKEQVERLIERLKKATLTISLGVRDGYLLLSLGATSERLHRLGQEPLLWERTEMAALRQQGDKDFTAISYVSQKFLQQANNLDAQLDNYVNLLERMLPQSELDKDLQKELVADARSLATDLKRAIPKPGAIMGFAFRSPRGFEGYTYDWGEHGGLDGSQKLTILDHVGGSPIAFWAARTKYAPESYDSLAKWMRRAAYYGERIGSSRLEPEQQALYQKLRVVLEPMAARLEQVIKTMWLPAFKEGQGAIVLDAKVVSPQWQKSLPPATRPLPMLELGIVNGVSDSDLVKRASAQLFAITQETLNVLHAASPENVPKVELPAPLSRDFSSGTVYYYTPPTDWGLDAKLAPNAGLSKDVLVLSLVPNFTVRLMDQSTPAVAGPLAQHDRPLAAASYFNNAALFEAFDLWIEYGIDQWSKLAAGANGGENTAVVVKEHVRGAVQFIQCFQSASSVSYFEAGALVTHSQWEFADRK